MFLMRTHTHGSLFSVSLVCTVVSPDRQMCNNLEQIHYSLLTFGKSSIGQPFEKMVHYFQIMNHLWSFVFEDLVWKSSGGWEPWNRPGKLESIETWTHMSLVTALSFPRICWQKQIPELFTFVENLPNRQLWGKATQLLRTLFIVNIPKCSQADFVVQLWPPVLKKTLGRHYGNLPLNNEWLR